MSNEKRAQWADGLDVPLMSENPGADVLYWVGCMGSFDQRNKRVAAACPFCITMFDDGIKGVEAEEKMQVEDIAEIVARAVEAKGDSTSAP